jgi:hypothetical protein
MRFHAPSVSASADGDYYQLSFGPLENGEAEDDPYDVRGPYLIVQRQFEMPDLGRCYVETDNESYVGHFRLRLAELSPTRIAFGIERSTNDQVEVTFSLSASEFEEVRRAAEIVLGLREPEPNEDEAL